MRLAHASHAIIAIEITDAYKQPVEGWKPHWAHPASWAPFTPVTNRDR